MLRNAITMLLFVTSSSVVDKALCYKPEVAGLRPDEVNELFSIYLILPASLGPGVHSAANRNEYQKQTNNVSGEQSAAGA
jgi:hypothetical protein